MEDKIEQTKSHMGGTRYKHPAMVMVGFHRVTCGGGVNLFGSSINNDSYIQLDIKRAEVDRHLSNDWFFGNESLIEVKLSPMQFAELLTSMNVGNGVPATLGQFNGEHFSLPKMETKSEQFKKEIKEDVVKTFGSIKGSVSRAKEILKKKTALTNAERQELLSGMEAIDRFAFDHLPFILDQFQEQMDKTVVEAKSAVDAFVQDSIVKTGIQAIKDQNIKLIEEQQ